MSLIAIIGTGVEETGSKDSERNHRDEG